MNKLLTALAATALISAPASAQVAGVIGGAHFETGNAAGFDISNKLEGSSATGFQQNMELKSDGIIAFGSAGTASSGTTVTPFSVATESSHVGGFAALNNGGKLTGSVQNFAQSEGSVRFNAFANQYSNFEVGAVGFAAFGF